MKILRHGLGGSVIDNYIYLLGGSDDESNYYKTFVFFIHSTISAEHQR